MQNCSHTTTDDLIRQLGSWNSAERRAAEESLAAGGESSVELLIAVLDEEVRRRKRRRKIIYGIAIGAFLVWLTMSWLMWPSGPLLNRNPVGFALQFILRLVMHVSLWMPVFGEASLRHKGVAGVLAKLSDMRLVGPLIKASEVNPAAERVLTQLLPQLKASDASMIDKEARAILNRRLAKHGKMLEGQGNSEISYLDAILKGLEQVGEADSIRVVKDLSEFKPSAPTGRQIRDAAQHCLPYLKARAEEQSIRMTLLRASSAASHSDELLRAAGHGPPGDNAHLVRAHNECA